MIFLVHLCHAFLCFGCLLVFVHLHRLKIKYIFLNALYYKSLEIIVANVMLCNNIWGILVTKHSLSAATGHRVTSNLNPAYTGWPQKNGTIDFSALCSHQQLSFFTVLDRASFPHYNKKHDHQIWLRTFYFMSNYLWTVIFRICH